MERAGLIRAGNHRALAALMRDLDDGRPGAEAQLASVVAGTPPPFVVGVTGPPGAGKSTLVDALCTRFRGAGQRVGIVAVDPSSPLRGGAILGDRIRMQQHATDAGVFIRSVATRGASGGLSASTAQVIAALGAGGFSTVLVETVGVGQAELDIATTADVTVVVMVPGLGDDVQTLKAGLLEVADVLVVNKGDRPGAEHTRAELAAMLELRRVTGGPGADVALLRVVATTGEGVSELHAALETLRAVAPEGRRRRRVALRLEQLVLARVAATTRAAFASGGVGVALVDQVLAGQRDAESAADLLLSRLRGG